MEKEIERIWDWVKAEFDTAEKSIAPTVVAILEVVKQEADNGTLDLLAEFIDTEFKTLLGIDAVGIVKRWIPKAFGIALALEDLYVDQTPAGLATFAAAITKALRADKTNRGRILTIVATDLAQQLDAFHNNGGTATFGQWVIWIEAEYTKLKE